ncbi:MULTISPECIES: DNA-3-methyladenine glycosylase [unclassified Rhodococcus (in: high G+C Gram-positive bacteria)]|uniref:DNA-3-methyladenine glycosylase family protein n=1 Tax=unclassified Rhodococcus (in: high G+C Gram-positive bacteria) TaxID=192944 RepID=UPI0016395EDB|nr:MULTISPECIES: DNA-3-methyladenine glycosylase 2 family protein [unclassified Rhodococcus (in: high G+C Gram-positive bacteria)]MBC2642356.1 DNA-3-methyladenine glycosylase 2 family protein [Rhodococcus sp. 3A]MBC2892901.1 DNA-3-methyladenine glycosylase 2 family protein [Rhodococcus sp. 4CII]
MRVLLPYRGPFTHAPLWSALRAHTVTGLERHDPDGTHTRVVNGPHGPALVSVVVRPADEYVEAHLTPAHPDDVEPLVAVVRRWLDLDADPLPIDAALSRHAALAPLVALRPGLRRLGSVDGFETAVLTILGQQVSLAAARTFGGRLVSAYGLPVHDGFFAFPEPETLAELTVEELRATVGLTGARAKTVHAVAEAATDGLRLGGDTDAADFRSGLMALPGIGPWTADYLTVRVLGDPDAFTPDDLVLKRALGVRTGRQAAVLAEQWRPWRAYALFHLWTDEAY